MKKRILSVATALGIMGAVGLMGATPAAAAASTPQAACGSGYTVLESHNLGFDQETGGPAARVSLLYNASSGYNCVVTMHLGGYVGLVAPTEAGVIAEGGTWHKDSGDFSYYAGPVYVYAPNTCVKYTGSIEYVNNGIFLDSYTSNFGYCG